MDWNGVISRVQTKVAETLSDNNIFSPEAAREVISDVQDDMVERIKCLEAYREITVGPTISGPTVGQLSAFTLIGQTNMVAPNGTLYWNLTKSSVGSVVTFSIYNDYNKATEVASGSVASLNATITLISQNNSGVSGSIHAHWSSNSLSNSNLIFAPQYYDFPMDMVEPILMKYDQNTEIKQREKQPVIYVPNYGTPRQFYHIGVNQFGLYPDVSAKTTIYFWYIKKSPEYAFNIRTSNINTPKITITPTGIKLSNSSVSVSHSFSLYSRIDNVCAAINADSIGVTATICDSCPPWEPAFNLEPINNFLLTADDQHLYLNLKVPTEMHKTLVEGVVEVFRQKDREYTLAGYHNTKYETAVKRLVAEWKSKRSSTGYYTIDPPNVSDFGGDTVQEFYAPPP